MKKWNIIYALSKQVPLPESAKKNLIVEAANRPLAVKQLKLNLHPSTWKLCIIVDCVEIKPENN